jgi:hypothetical protein
MKSTKKPPVAAFLCFSWLLASFSQGKTGAGEGA